MDQNIMDEIETGYEWIMEEMDDVDEIWRRLKTEGRGVAGEVDDKMDDKATSNEWIMDEYLDEKGSE